MHAPRWVAMRLVHAYHTPPPYPRQPSLPALGAHVLWEHAECVHGVNPQGPIGRPDFPPIEGNPLGIDDVEHLVSPCREAHAAIVQVSQRIIPIAIEREPQNVVGLVFHLVEALVLIHVLDEFKPPAIRIAQHVPVEERWPRLPRQFGSLQPLENIESGLACRPKADHIEARLMMYVAGVGGACDVEERVQIHVGVEVVLLYIGEHASAIGRDFRKNDRKHDIGMAVAGG
ncbi:hypothetical protein BC938DRAFT_479623 [Jimgerdemannia flammicorona]|uniref:Uncharacterized protein n=1 Tax=Jimgerdemannia flammicorona TaxID=994334 RepID=A0A433QXU3_9FUNG|nr:hypothetical protein BC938DRAFT_479623 [Jimgerdemannia flammicorona]